MPQLPQPGPVSTTDAGDVDHAKNHAASTITKHHHRHNFAPMAFETSGPEPPSLTSLSDILENLPSAVKSGLGPISTIRRSVSIRGWASYFYDISSNTMGATVSHYPRPSAAAQCTTVVSRTASTTTSTTTVGVQQHSNRGEKRAAVPVQGQPQPQAQSKAQAQAHRRLPEPSFYQDPDPSFGINRFCGLQGQLLVNNALSDSRPLPMMHGQYPASAAGSSSIDRKAYVQGVAWLVHGLPNDLDQHERTELIRAMPPALLEEVHRTPVFQHQPAAYPPTPSSLSSKLALPAYGYLGVGDASVGEAGLTLAQRVARVLVVQLLVPFHLLWAYMVMLLSRAAQLEREYKVAEQLVKHSGELGYGVGRGGVRLSGAIYNHGGGRAGQLVKNVVTYTADGLVKGISDGIREARTERRQVEAED